jgi:hypothetical protein
MPRGAVLVSAKAIQVIERKIASIDKKMARHEREREGLIVKRDAMRTILGTPNGHRAGARSIERPRSEPFTGEQEAVSVPQALVLALQQHNGPMSPREIRAAVLRAGVKPTQLGSSGNYIYSVIARALKRGQIAQARGGRYVLTPGAGGDTRETETAQP